MRSHNVANAEQPVSANSYAGVLFELTINGVEFRFRVCPQGMFRWEGEDITVPNDFLMLETAVTQEQWEAVCRPNPSHFNGAKLPVECVSWDMCQDFVALLNRFPDTVPTGTKFALPTEIQWEYACRAGNPIPAEDERDAMAWHRDNSEGKTHLVGMKKPNAWSIYDMYGNVWEWCSESHLIPSEVREPELYRIARGGAWSYDVKSCISEKLSNSIPGARGVFIGFRLAIVTGEIAPQGLTGQGGLHYYDGYGVRRPLDLSQLENYKRYGWIRLETMIDESGEPFPGHSLLFPEKESMPYWYYYDGNGQKQGLLNEIQLKEMVRAGRILPITVIETKYGRQITAGRICGLFPPTDDVISPLDHRYFFPLKSGSNWFYYDDNGQRQGLVNDTQLKNMASDGRIHFNTLVETEEGQQGLARQVCELFPAQTPNLAAKIAQKTSKIVIAPHLPNC